MGPRRPGWMWIVPLAILLACGGCGSSDSSDSTRGPQTLDDPEDVQQLFDAIAADLAGLLVEGLQEVQQKAYPDCPGGGTLTVTAVAAVFTGCTISGITIDGTTSTFSSSVEGTVTSVTLSGVFTISGLLEGEIIVREATFVRGGQDLCWRAQGTVGGTMFDVQSPNQSCSDAASCGDGTVSGTEECDDGNSADGDGCDSMCLLEVETCDPSSPACLIGEEFNQDPQENGWTLGYINAQDLVYEVEGGELVVTGMTSTLECNLYGQEWSFAHFTKTIGAVDDYRLTVSFSWDPLGDAAIQKVQVTSLGPGMSCQVVDQVHDSDLNVPACSMPGAAGQLEGIEGAGAGTFVIESCGADIRAQFNGTPVATGAASAATGVRIWFGWYKLDAAGSPPQCTPAPSPVSSFGEIRVDRVSLEAGCGP